MDDILKILRVSASGMKSQGTRLRAIAENIANADSLPTSPEDTPYRRKLVMFKNALDRATGLDTVRVHKIQDSNGSFGRKYLPGHPAADADGYVVTPNVKTMIEMADMREAQRSYEANLSVIKVSKRMLQQTIDVLR